MLYPFGALFHQVRQTPRNEALASTFPFGEHDRCLPYTAETLLPNLLVRPTGGAYLIFRSVAIDQVLTSPFILIPPG